MKEYQYVCTECGQQIEVNGPMREAILNNGCPVCSASAETDHFSDS